MRPRVPFSGEFKEMAVLILDVCLFIGHLALPQEVSQVPVLQKPPIELLEDLLAADQRFCIVRKALEERRKVARPSDKFYLFGIVSFALVEIAPILKDQFLNLLIVCFSEKLPNNTFGYISAYVFLVVALVLSLQSRDSLSFDALLHLHLHMQVLRSDCGLLHHRQFVFEGVVWLPNGGAVD